MRNTTILSYHQNIVYIDTTKCQHTQNVYRRVQVLYVQIIRIVQHANIFKIANRRLDFGVLCKNVIYSDLCLVNVYIGYKNNGNNENGVMSNIQ